MGSRDAIVVSLWSCSAGAAVAASLAVASAGAWATGRDPLANAFVVPVVAVVAVGAAVMGGIQSRVVPHLVRRPEGWFVATVAGAVLATTVAIASRRVQEAGLLPSSFPFADSVGASGALASLGILGAFQWRILRRNVDGAGSWVGSVVVYSLGAGLPWALVNRFSGARLGEETLWILTGFTFGGLMGLTLVELAQRPREDSSPGGSSFTLDERGELPEG